MSRKIYIYLTVLFMATAMNAQTFTIDNIVYEVISSQQKQVKVKKYRGTIKDIIISPTVINEGITYTVTEIGYEAFREKRVDYVYLPKTIEKISESAFFISGLKAFTISSAVQSIEAFSLMEVGDAFGHYYNYNFELTYLSNNPITFNAPRLFQDEQVPQISLIIPEGTQEIYTTRNWRNFKSIKETFTRNEVRYIAASDTTAEVRDYIGTATNYTIPSSVSFGGASHEVSSIGTFAFVHKDFSSVILPASITGIEKFGFYKNENLAQVQVLRSTPFVLNENVF
ncbi:MAG: leucine-rich repeat protein, partial [Wenyingzhuangia sp.]|uniref:leucine-rich repeat protein n=1 Tax=Wenyingzhuangia sp. TaxID=1964193 RepID=UPI003219FCF1